MSFFKIARTLNKRFSSVVKNIPTCMRSHMNNHAVCPSQNFVTNGTFFTEVLFFLSFSEKSIFPLSKHAGKTSKTNYATVLPLINRNLRLFDTLVFLIRHYMGRNHCHYYWLTGQHLDR